VRFLLTPTPPARCRLAFDDWIHSHETWSKFAVTCCLASDYILAVDYYKKAIEMAERHNKKLMKSATAKSEKKSAGSSRRMSKLDVKGSILNVSLAKIWFALAKCQMRSGEEEHAKNSLQRAVMLDHSSVQMQSFLDSWVSTSSRFEVDLSLSVKEILQDVVVVKSVKGGDEGGGEEGGGGGGGGEPKEYDGDTDGHIMVPIRADKYSVGCVGVTNLTLFRPKVLRKRRDRESVDEMNRRGLEEGIVNYLKDVGKWLGPAYERLRRKELFNSFKEVGESVKRGKKLGVGGILKEASKVIREGVVWCEGVEVWQMVEVKDVEYLKKLAEDAERGGRSRASTT
jgi:tetratricopeptide (TPR) repeat protein